MDEMFDQQNYTCIETEYKRMWLQLHTYRIAMLFFFFFWLFWLYRFFFFCLAPQILLYRYLVINIGQQGERDIFLNHRLAGSTAWSFKHIDLLLSIWHAGILIDMIDLSAEGLSFCHSTKVLYWFEIWWLCGDCLSMVYSLSCLFGF